jgi:hypothetical protein
MSGWRAPNIFHNYIDTSLLIFNGLSVKLEERGGKEETPTKGR